MARRARSCRHAARAHDCALKFGLQSLRPVSDDLDHIDTERHAPLTKLYRVDETLGSLNLRHERLRFVHPLCQVRLRQSLDKSQLSELGDEEPILRRMLFALAHESEASTPNRDN
jgi:hypothetical protein